MKGGERGELVIKYSLPPITFDTLVTGMHICGELIDHVNDNPGTWCRKQCSTHRGFGKQVESFAARPWSDDHDDDDDFDDDDADVYYDDDGDLWL